MEGVDHLVKLLQIVKKGGLEVAFADDGRHLSTFQPYQEPLRSMRHALQDSKLCMAVLDTIKTRLARRIRNLQKRCAPLVLEDGIKRIPDEILAQIFETGHRMTSYSDFSLAVSHVSGFQDCDAVDNDWELTLETPKPKSFRMDSLKITLSEIVASEVVLSLYKILTYLTASLVDISLLMHGNSYDIWRDAGIFPYGYSIRLEFGSPCSLSVIDSLPPENRKALQSFQFEQSSFDHVPNELPTWSHFPSLRHIQFRHCVIPEEIVEDMVRSILAHEDFESIEIISPQKISEKFLFDLQDEVGERLVLCL
ncbi:hypothetical protein BD410DRAFT_844557 [Rickenella mellea]|uniref:Uncharacterized protein n=1 Tax=Rickenella mellea TaxID=50990 RepID=A0A4Y7PLG6_9AGAM|nr:hypothetical protein BD410DRAFT_844557 [Rickenella mellea]